MMISLIIRLIITDLGVSEALSKIAYNMAYILKKKGANLLVFPATNATKNGLSYRYWF